ATIQFNDVFQNKTNFAGFTPHKSNLTVDPLFVDTTKGNYRLKPNSPLIDAGTTSVVWLRHDMDYYPQLFPFTTRGRLPDIGAYEAHTNDLTLTVPPKIGGTARLTLSGAPGLASIFVGFNQAASPVAFPFNVALIDNYTILTGVTSSQAVVQIPIPNDLALEGTRASLQGVYVDAKQNFELINVVEVFVRK
ncbi:MAG: hypothetical protein ACYST0_13455, partial [Planctomycetota bacterium]